MKKVLVAALIISCISLAGCGASGNTAADSGVGGNTAADSGAAGDTEADSGSVGNTEADSGAAGDAAEDKNRDTMYQVALLQSLTQGYFDGIITVDELKGHGDTGIGTFEGVNGEMIVLDGVVYQAISDGSIVTPEGNETVPFANVTYFEEDGSIRLSNVDSMESLQKKLNEMVSANGKNMFYMVKVNGDFSHIKVRSEYKQEKPYGMLDEALAKDQVEFDYDDVSGTMVGIYCPDYMGDLNSTGWHFHFITEDLTKGGHVLSVEIKEAKASYDITDGFEMRLEDKKEFQDMDLSKDVDEAIRSAETKTLDK